MKDLKKEMREDIYQILYELVNTDWERIDNFSELYDKYIDKIQGLYFFYPVRDMEGISEELQKLSNDSHDLTGYLDINKLALLNYIKTLLLEERKKTLEEVLEIMGCTVTDRFISGIDPKDEKLDKIISLYVKLTTK